jgi:hypothetical protein
VQITGDTLTTLNKCPQNGRTEETMGQTKKAFDFSHLNDQKRTKVLPSVTERNLITSCDPKMDASGYPRFQKLFEVCPTVEMRRYLLDYLWETHEQRAWWVTKEENAQWFENTITDLKKGDDSLWSELFKFYVQNIFLTNDYETIGRMSLRAIEFAIFLCKNSVLPSRSNKVMKILLEAMSNTKARVLLYWQSPSLRPMLKSMIEQLILDSKKENYKGYDVADWNQAFRAIRLVINNEDGSFLPLLDKLHKKMKDQKIYLQIFTQETWSTRTTKDEHLAAVKNTLDDLESKHQIVLTERLSTYLNSHVKQGVTIDLDVPTESIPIGQPATIRFKITPPKIAKDQMPELLGNLLLRVWDNFKTFKFVTEEPRDDVWRFDNQCILEFQITRHSPGTAVLALEFCQRANAYMPNDSQKFHIDFDVPESPELPPEPTTETK